MSIERKGRAGTMRERIRIVCDSCGGATGWVEPKKIPAPDLAATCNMRVSSDGTRHVCGGCERKARDAIVDPFTGVTMDDVINAAIEMTNAPEKGAMVKAGHPMIGTFVCLTGTMAEHRDRMREILRAMGIEVTTDPLKANYVVVGDTGRHGVTSKLRTAQGCGAKVIPEDKLWAATTAWEDGRVEEAKEIIDAEYTVTEHDDGSVEVTPLDKRLPEAKALITPPPKKKGPRWMRKKRAQERRDAADPVKRRKAINKLLGDCSALLDELDEVEL